MKKLLLLSLFSAILLCFLLNKIAHSKVVVNIIGEEKEFDKDFIQNLKEYLPEFEYFYYCYKDPYVKYLLKDKPISYLPFVFYDERQLQETDWDLLNKNRLIEKRDNLLIFPIAMLHYLTKVHLLNRGHIPNQLALFAMSLCPYAQKAEFRIIKFIKENKLPIEIKFYFIANIEDGKITSLHGPDEVEENIHQLLIAKYWPEKLFDYLLLTEKESHFEALKKVGIPYKKIDRLRKEGYELLKENIKIARELKIYASPTFLWENVYLISGLDNAMTILEQEKESIYKQTHPVVEYIIVGLLDYEACQRIFINLEDNFRLKGKFIPSVSPLLDKYKKKFNIKYLPFIYIKKTDTQALNRIIREKLHWQETKNGFIMPVEKVLEISPIYYLHRPKIPNQIDIIAKKKELNMFKGSSFVKSLLNSGIKINLNRQGLYKELGIKKLPLILWENQYLVSSFNQLLTLPDIQEKLSGLKPEKKIILDFFSSPSCKFCKDVKEKILSVLEEKYKQLIEIVEFNTLESKNYEFLIKMEENFNVQKTGIPKIFIADKVLIGKNEIENNLEMEILNSLVTGEEIFDIQAKPFKLEYFYNSYYLNKNKDDSYLFYDFLPKIESRYKGKVEIIHYDIANRENLERMLLLGKEDYLTPKIYVTGIFLQGRDEIEKNLDRVIQEKLLALCKENIVVSKIFKFTLPTIISAGLLDGVNPCAFTVIVFFISFLTITGYKKHHMLYIGISFILAVFITYFLIGLGLFSAFYKLGVYQVLADILRYIIIIIVFSLAMFNLYDYLIYKIKKTPQSTILKLPSKIKFLIQKTIGKGYRREDEKVELGVMKLIIVALGVGFIVSILESICTGQVYFPTVAFVAQLPGIMKIKAILYLFIYNLMFIVPLMVIFLLGLVGVTSQRYANFLRKHLGKVKLLTFLLFTVIGYMLLILY